MSDSAPITRLNAALEGRYRIERELGEGGMATVYLADDLKHERKVALKVLKPELAAVVGAERFLTEIKTTANLQHPHILPLFDSGEADSFLFYVMPYVEGESLRDRLDREHQLPVDEAVQLVTNVAEALEHAHSRGVIHRDVKPENILLQAGKPVVSDFGIALAVGTAGGGRLTGTGMSLGTPHYMSPEQATGDVGLGPGTDVYALGCVLYETLVGEPPHTGSTPQAILGKIIQAEPVSATKARATVPANVDAVIRRALEKVPADRFAGAGDLAGALADVEFRHDEARGREPVAAMGPWNRLSLTMTALAVLSSAIAAWGWLGPAPEGGGSAVPVRWELSGFDFYTLGGKGNAISPDGSLIASVSAEPGSGIFVRRLDQAEFREIPGTEGAYHLTISPDGEWVAFEQRGVGGISRVEVEGGPVLPVANGVEPHWGSDGKIYFRSDAGLSSISPSGSELDVFLATDSLTGSRPFPLPGGQAVVFQSPQGKQAARLMLVDLRTGAVRDLGVFGNDPTYVATGHLVFGHSDNALMAVPFDLGSLEVTGEPFTVLPDVAVFTQGATKFDVSSNGTVIYGGGAPSTRASTLVEVDLAGVETPLPLGPSTMWAPRYSPDGRRIAYFDGDGITRIYDAATGAGREFATGIYPVWSASGDFVYFNSGGEVSRRRADFSEAPERLAQQPGQHRFQSVSPGDSISVLVSSGSASGDLILMRRGEDGVQFEEFVASEWNESSPAVSPDGRWIAYTSNQSGEDRVYVQSFPVPSGQQPVSPGRGREPKWHPDGHTIYYKSGSRFVAVDVTTDSTFAVSSAPRLLFENRVYIMWDIHPDGSRFVAVNWGGASLSSGDEVYLVTNWFSELCERAGGC